jgi:hypothetical protein
MSDNILSFPDLRMSGPPPVVDQTAAAEVAQKAAVDHAARRAKLHEMRMTLELVQAAAGAGPFRHLKKADFSFLSRL